MESKISKPEFIFELYQIQIVISQNSNINSRKSNLAEQIVQELLSDAKILDEQNILDFEIKTSPIISPQTR
jgi:hypothetical protein